MKNGQTLTAICLSLKALVEGGQSMSVCIGQSLIFLMFLSSCLKLNGLGNRNHETDSHFYSR